MDRAVLDTIEREIDQEVQARFPGSAVRQAVLQFTSTVGCPHRQATGTRSNAPGRYSWDQPTSALRHMRVIAW